MAGDYFLANVANGNGPNVCVRCAEGWLAEYWVCGRRTIEEVGSDVGVEETSSEGGGEGSETSEESDEGSGEESESGDRETFLPGELLDDEAFGANANCCDICGCAVTSNTAEPVCSSCADLCSELPMT